MFTLYQYLHCPYCVRADMVANYTGIAHKKAFLLNDDDTTCQQLIGAKMVPILQFEDGSAMGESLDIVEKILAMAGPDKQLKTKQHADEVTALLNENSAAINQLLFPRNVMIEQPEFATDSARDYFQAKKEKALGMSFADAYTQSAPAIAKVNALLAALPALASPQQSQQLGWDDVLIFPLLRNLTMVKDLQWPAPVALYVNDVAAFANIHLYWHQAV